MALDVIEESFEEGLQPAASQQQHKVHNYELSLEVLPAADSTGYGAPATPSKRRLTTPTLVNLVLRVATAVFSLISFSIMAAISRNGFRYSDYKAFFYILVMNITSFIYSILHIAHLGYTHAFLKTIVPKRAEVYATFLCDQVKFLLCIWVIVLDYLIVFIFYIKL